MAFPMITAAQTVLDAIEGNHAFIVKRDEENDLLIVNYLLNTPDTFPAFTGDPEQDLKSSILRECRGITFRLSTGEILSRKFHKFFNLGERDEVTVNRIDWTRPHVILEKLDGSMITPVMVDGQVRYCTKMGLTDVAKPCEEFATSFEDYRYDGFCQFVMEKGYTPIFEWCSRKQRIVVDYPEDALILTAVRHTVNGTYLTHDAMTKLAASWSIPVVKVIPHDGSYKSLKDFIESQEDLEGSEGFVIRFDSGDMYKVKGEWYLKLHKMVDLMKNERHLIELILEEKIDDVLGMIRAEDRHAVERLEHELQTNMTDLATRIFEFVRDARAQILQKMDNGIFELSALEPAMKKEFAVEWVQKTDLPSGLLFRVWQAQPLDYQAAWNAVKSAVLGSLSTNTKLDANRHLIGGIRWADIYAGANAPEE